MIIPKYIHADLSAKKIYNYEMPIGIGYVSAAIKKAGYELSFLNLNHIEGKIEDKVKEELDKKKYDVVCSGHFGIGYLVLEKIIKTAKSHPSCPKIIIGGPIITSEPELMTENLEFDFGVVGEGEETIVELLDAIENNKDKGDIDGIIYKEEGKIVRTKPRKAIENLDELSFPDYEDIGYEEKLDNSFSNTTIYGILDNPRTYALIGSRGCPFKCTFCYHTTGEKYRIRSLDNIFKELRFAINKYKINSFQLYDDLFSVDKERLGKFCEGIIALSEEFGIKLRWICQLWVGSIDEEMLRILKEAGCGVVSLGFESYSEEVLKSMKKPIVPKQIDQAIKVCMKVGMPFVGNFIFGDVAETKETARTTLDYWKNQCNNQVKLFFIQPYPGSRMYEHCIEKGLIKDKLDFIKNKIHHTNIINMTDNMTDEEFEELKKEVYSLSCNDENYKTPFKSKRVGNKVYDIYVKCPFCNKVNAYKNNFFKRRFYYRLHNHCRECGMRFNTVSKLYKFTMDHYLELDSLRRNYLKISESILKKRI